MSIRCQICGRFIHKRRVRFCSKCTRWLRRVIDWHENRQT